MIIKPVKDKPWYTIQGHAEDLIEGVHEVQEALKDVSKPECPYIVIWRKGHTDTISFAADMREAQNLSAAADSDADGTGKKLAFYSGGATNWRMAVEFALCKIWGKYGTPERSIMSRR